MVQAAPKHERSHDKKKYTTLIILNVALSCEIRDVFRKYMKIPKKKNRSYFGKILEEGILETSTVRYRCGLLRLAIFQY